jgi:hypothetical protein
MKLPDARHSTHAAYALHTGGLGLGANEDAGRMGKATLLPPALNDVTVRHRAGSACGFEGSDSMADVLGR